MASVVTVPTAGSWVGELAMCLLLYYGINLLWNKAIIKYSMSCVCSFTITIFRTWTFFLQCCCCSQEAFPRAVHDKLSPGHKSPCQTLFSTALLSKLQSSLCPLGLESCQVNLMALSVTPERKGLFFPRYLLSYLLANFLMDWERLEVYGPLYTLHLCCN